LFLFLSNINIAGQSGLILKSPAVCKIVKVVLSSETVEKP
ncbi:unnamed protein product, partial [marine sediment metagenome]